MFIQVFSEVVPSVVGGILAWTLAEYLLHRFLMHGLGGRGIASREHLLHHADPEGATGRPVLSWLGIIVVGALLLLLPGLALGAPIAGIGTYLGWLIGYGTYQQIHNRSHTHAPRGAYGRWVRRHHLHHHHGHPSSNHGVTSPLWDRVFGTLEIPGAIKIPRRHAMPWLLGPDGTVAPEHASDYTVVDGPTSSARLAAIDRARAFAGLPPAGG